MHNHFQHSLLSHNHNSLLIILSVVIAAFASYTALDIANSISFSRGKIKWFWLLGGSLAMGIGIWSMHFIGMLAFSIDGVSIFYDVPLLVLSIVVAIVASAVSLIIIAHQNASVRTYFCGSLAMGAAISGMHYIGIWSMRMPLEIIWDYNYVVLSVLVAIAASFIALLLAFKLKDDDSIKGFLYRGAGSLVMGGAIASMHYIAMFAMDFVESANVDFNDELLLASNGLASAVIVSTLLILGIALVGSNIDRTLSKKNILNEALQDALKARDEFLSIASHELKTPLTSLKLQTEIILRKASSAEVVVEKLLLMLEQSHQSINRITRVVDDMLDISRLSIGKLTLQLEEFDLSQLVYDVVERMRANIESTGGSVVFVKKTMIVGHWDKFRIEQVLINLIANAIQYAPGTVIEIELYKSGGFAQLCVSDKGRGIPPEEFEKIFLRYERGRLSNDQRGLGIGLFIVKEILQMHKGDISIQSELGKGSKFTVLLPIT